MPTILGVSATKGKSPLGVKAPLGRHSISSTRSPIDVKTPLGRHSQIPTVRKDSRSPLGVKAPLGRHIPTMKVGGGSVNLKPLARNPLMAKRTI